MLFEASIAASRELPHTLLIVVAGVETGNPEPRATCLAGFCPHPACNTCQNMKSSTIPLAGSNPTLEHSSLTAKTPKSTADKEDKEPMKEPMGVLDTAQITTFDSPINWLKGYLS